MWFDRVSTYFTGRAKEIHLSLLAYTFASGEFIFTYVSSEYIYIYLYAAINTSGFSVRLYLSRSIDHLSNWPVLARGYINDGPTNATE